MCNGAKNRELYLQIRPSSIIHLQPAFQLLSCHPQSTYIWISPYIIPGHHTTSFSIEDRQGHHRETLSLNMLVMENSVNWSLSINKCEGCLEKQVAQQEHSEELKLKAPPCSRV